MTAAHVAGQILSDHVVNGVQGLVAVPVHVEAAAVLAHGDTVLLQVVGVERARAERSVLQVAGVHPEAGRVVHVPHVGAGAGGHDVAVARVARECERGGRAHAAVAFEELGVVLVTTAAHDDAVVRLDRGAAGHAAHDLARGHVLDERGEAAVRAVVHGRVLLGVAHLVVQVAEQVGLGELVRLGARALGAGPGVELAVLGLGTRLVRVAQREVVHREAAGEQPLQVLVDAGGEGLEHVVGDGLAALGGGHVLQVLHGVGLVVRAEEEVAVAHGRAAGGRIALFHEDDLLLGGLLRERDGGGEAGDARAHDEDVALLVELHVGDVGHRAAQGTLGACGLGGKRGHGAGEADDAEAGGRGPGHLHERAARGARCNLAHVFPPSLCGASGEPGRPSVRGCGAWCGAPFDEPDSRSRRRAEVSHRLGKLG